MVREALYWHEVAFVCRYGCQDVYRVIGRDPATRPLTARERALFSGSVLRHVQAEFTPREDDNPPPSDRKSVV